MYQLYARIAPKPADWPVLLTKLGEMLRKDYDWSKDVATIKSPTLLVFGDADAVRTAHAVQLFELLGGGKRDAGWDGSGMSNARLAILPGLTHYTIFSSPSLGIRCHAIPRRSDAENELSRAFRVRFVRPREWTPMRWL